MNLVQPFRYLFWYQSLPLDLSPFRFLDSLTLLIYVIYVSSFEGIGYVTPYWSLCCRRTELFSATFYYRIIGLQSFWEWRLLVFLLKIPFTLDGIGWTLYSKLKLYMKRFDLDVFYFFSRLKGVWLLDPVELIIWFSSFFRGLDGYWRADP